MKAKAHAERVGFLLCGASARCYVGADTEEDLRMRFAALATLSALSLLSMALMTGCGAAPATVASPVTTTGTGTTAPVPSAGPIAGRWTFSPAVALPVFGTGTLPAITGAGFSGALTVKGSEVTGAGEIPSLTRATGNVACTSAEAVTLHGTVNAARHLSLVSDPTVRGDVLRIEVDVADRPYPTATGTTTITGPCATTGDVGGRFFAPVEGAFRGTLVSVDLATRLPTKSGTVDAVFAETAPDSTGRSVVSGTLNVQLSACSTQIPIEQPRYGGADIFLGLLTFPGTLPSIFTTVSESADGNLVNASLANLGPDCKPVAISSTLSVSSVLTAELAKQ